jgi:predicted phage terminase large subunit-like protein
MIESPPVSFSNSILTRYQYEWKKIPASTIQDMRTLARTDLIEFIPFFYKKLKLNWFHREIADALNPFIPAIESQQSPRLMLEAPPRHSKSLMTTRCFPAFVMGRHPEWDIIVVSGTQPLADAFGRAVRDILTSPLFRSLFPNFRLRDDSKAIDTMQTTAGGTLRLVGCEGNIVGAGAHLLLADDVISSVEQADSETRMDKIMEWFNGVAMNRLMPGGGVIVMHTRWNPRDFIGRILETDADAWTRKSYPALALGDDPHRKRGEALQPEWYSKTLLEKERDRLVRAGQERKWLALFQQQPRNETGGFFTRQDMDKAIVPVKSFPSKSDLTWHIGCDFATSTKSQADKSAIIPVGLDSDGDMWVGSDFVWERMNVDVALDKLFAIIKKYKTYPFAFVAMERGVIQNILRPLITTRQRKTGNYFQIEEITRVDSKHVHAATLQARFRAGAVKLPDTNEIRLDVTTQLLNFEPGATNQEDDWIDAIVNLTMSLDKLRRPGKVKPKKKKTPEEEEEEIWKNILASGKPPSNNACPFTRLNGDNYVEKRK